MGAQTTSQVADAMTSLGLAQVLLFDLNPGDTSQAFLRGLALAAFPLLLVGPLAGFLADRCSRRALLVAGQRLRALLTTGAVFASMLELPVVGYATFVMLLLATRVLYTARATVIPRLVEPHQLVAADSTSLMLSMGAGLVGVLVAAGLELLELELVFVLAVVLHALASEFYRRVDIPLGGGRDAGKGRDWGAAVAQLRHREVRFSIVSSGAGKFLLGGCYACIALVIDARFDVEPTGYAAVFGVAGAGTFVGTFTAGWVIERVPRKSVAVLVSLVSGTAILAVAVVPQLFGALAAIVVASFAFQNLRVCNDAAVQSTARSGSLGRVFAVYDVVYNLSFVVGAAVALIVGVRGGVWAVLYACGLGYAALAAVLVMIGSGDPRPMASIRNPTALQASRSNTLRVSSTTRPDIASATLDGATPPNSDHSVSTTRASAPKQAPVELSA